jgi:putative transposase
MARQPRLEFEYAIYHVTARGNERRLIFRAEGDRQKFLTLLERGCARHEVSLLGFVLMGNHFHLVAQTHRANLSRWMHWLLVSYTTWSTGATSAADISSRAVTKACWWRRGNISWP